MTEHPTSEMLALHAGGDLPLVEAQTVDEHLDACRVCRAEFEECAESLDALRELAVEPDALELGLSRERLRKPEAPGVRWAMVAAAAMAVILAAVSLVWMRETSPMVNQVRAKVEIQHEAEIKPERTEQNGRAKQVRVKETALSKSSAQAGRTRRVTGDVEVVEVSRLTKDGEPAELRLASSNPKVVVLWQVSNGNEGSEQ